MAYFQMRKSDRQLTIFTTHFTTISPQKHHILHRISSKTPCKTATPPQKKKTEKKIGIGGRVSSPPLPHHRTSGSASGGSRS
jgi:hypothetical protein